MEIRYAKKEDVNRIIELCKLHANFEKANFDIENKQKLFAEYFFALEHDLKCLVVEVDTQIVGYATFMKQFSTWDTRFYVYLDCLFFVEKMRRKSLGSKMMQKIKEYAISQDCKEIQWQTPMFNKRAIAFYEKIGASSKTKERFFWNV